MSMSAFFSALRTSYQAEIDDLASDSEGKNVLSKRLAQKRTQLPFLKQMMEISPEMVAVVFHGGFKFPAPAVMEHLITLESDEFPEWASLTDALELTPWAQTLADVFLQEPQGEWFMTLAATLEYLHHRPSAHDRSAHDDHGDEHGHPDASDTHERPTKRRDIDHGHDYNKDDDHDHDPNHDETSAQWLEDQGFDRKE